MTSEITSNVSAPLPRLVWMQNKARKTEVRVKTRPFRKTTILKVLKVDFSVCVISAT